MANVNTDICDIVKKCKILLLDIEGTTTSISFVKDKLFPYAEENVKEFLDNQWEKEEVKEVVAALRKLAIEDQEKSVEGSVAIPGEDSPKNEQIEALVNNVKWQMSADRKVGPLKQLQGLIWKLGYDKGDIKGHVYDDVSPALEQWKSTEGQKVYIYSSGSVQAQKLLFGQSVAGDLLPLIEGHFDTAIGAKQEAASYATIAEKIGCKPEEILFLTDIVKEAEAARASGLQAALVSREGSAPPPGAGFVVLTSLAQLAPNNKRKPDEQVDELPAKVPKTDIQDNVKTNSEVKAPDATETTPATVETPAAEPSPTTEQEKMEVEEPTVDNIAEPKQTESKDEVKPVQVETVVEEITDVVEPDVPVVDVEPVIIDTGDKIETVETEQMEAESMENGETVTEKPKENGAESKKEPVAEETPPTVITEIEEVTENLNEVADIIEDLVPVVEEPANEDMEELQNVGEVLEKECDEILSKVQDVTNLDSIPIKPLLNTIAEETMETENTDSNDIVDRILDTEMELGIKSGEDIDLNTVQEIVDSKTEVTESKDSDVKIEANEEKPAVTAVEEKSVTSEAATESVVSEESTKKVDDINKPVTNGDASKSNLAPTEENVSQTKADTESNKIETKTPAQETEKPTQSTEQTTPVVNNETDSEKVEEKVQKSEIVEEKVQTEAKEVEKEAEKQVNGKTTNGNGNGELNGEASKDEELNARLSVDNGNGAEVVNGANGDSKEVDKENAKIEPEIPDIKVKSVPIDEPRTDPLEQPTEA